MKPFHPSRALKRPGIQIAYLEREIVLQWSLSTFVIPGMPISRVKYLKCCLVHTEQRLGARGQSTFPDCDRTVLGALGLRPEALQPQTGHLTVAISKDTVYLA